MTFEERIGQWRANTPIQPTGRQERAVLRALQTEQVMCGAATQFYLEEYITVRRLADCINDLRKKGWNIETVKWCDQHDHPESRQIEYWLVK